MEQPPVVYLKAANETFNAEEQYGCLSRLIFEINPDEGEVPPTWKNFCPDAKAQNLVRGTCFRKCSRDAR